MTCIAIRILLALSLALWSPAWCCCALQAVTGGERECSIDVVTSGCCSSAAARPAASCCDEAEQAPCQCGDRPSELNRLDTSVKIAAPTLDRAPFAAVIHPDICADVDATASACSNCSGVLAHPPPWTLLDQHCLLLI